MSYCFEPIAIIHSPFRKKFSTPRQAGLTPSVRSRIELLPEFANLETIRDLDGFSHIWLAFVFHQTYGKEWHPTVRPPRLGGNQRVGVFSSRSPFRPNPIGLSAVALVSITSEAGKITLEVQGADLIDGTPILDIKPYIPYSDCLPEATGGFADQAPKPELQVVFSDGATQHLTSFRCQVPELETLIRETLSLDPRPAYKQNEDDDREYGVLLDRYNVRWKVEGEVVLILSIEQVE